tara:strand:- start:66 stop:380 length:315 start_codon:yes stop_codon:yes gene_type:complete
MKYFKHLDDNVVLYYQPEGTNMCIPEAPGNTDYDNMLEEVAANTSTIVEVDDTPVPTWEDNRIAKIEDGGYGTWREQMEMIGEQGIDVFQTHVQTVKATYPKPE